jgi:hypothetical protein
MTALPDLSYSAFGAVLRSVALRALGGWMGSGSAGGAEMSRILVMVAPGAGFAPEALAAAWNADGDAAAAGTARVEAAGGEVFPPGLVELVAIPLVVNVASSALYDLVKKLAARLRPDDGQEPRVEQPEIAAGGSDVIIVVRGGDGLR